MSETLKNILVIDDDDESRDILRSRLEQHRYNVSEAVNGEEGVSTAQQTLPDLIILDVMMPKLDGWKVCRMLKAYPQTKHIPVIMLTAKNQQIEELRGWESGADEYMMKPCDHGVLLSRIASFLSKGVVS